MSFDVKPGHSRALNLTGGNVNEIKTYVAEIIERLRATHDRVVIWNMTRDCQINVLIQDKTLHIRVTNEKEDSIFRFQPETKEATANPEEENPAAEIA